MNARVFQDLPMSGEQTVGRMIDVPEGSYLVYATVDTILGDSQITCAIFSGDGNVNNFPTSSVLQNGHLTSHNGGNLGVIAMSGAYSGAAAKLWVDCAAAPEGSSPQATIHWVMLTALKVGTLQRF